MVKWTLCLLLLLVAISTPHAETLSAEDRQRYEFCLQQAESLSSNATGVIALLRSDGPRASSVDLNKLLEQIASTVQGLNLLVADARRLLNTGNDAVARVGPVLDSVASSLVTLDGEMKALGVTLRQEIQSTGLSIRTDVRAMTEKLTADLTKLFDAGVEEIRLVGGSSQEVLITIRNEVSGVSTTVKASLDDLSTTLTRLIGEQGASISQTIQDLLRAGIASVEKMTADASRLMVTLDAKVSNIGDQLVTSIAGLSEYVAKMIAAMTEFMNETTKTLHDVRVATERTARFFTGIHGRITTEFNIAGPDSVDSSAILDLWRESEYDEEVFKYTHLGIRHVDTDPRFDVQFGFRDHDFDMGFGYIEEGLGLSAGYNRFGRSGFDLGLSASRFRDPLLRLDIGFKTRAGLRLFGAFERPWSSTAGIGYHRWF